MRTNARTPFRSCAPLVVLASMTATPAIAAQQPVRDQCAALSADRLASLARTAAQPTQIDTTLHVLPGGQNVTLVLPRATPENSVYCAKFEDPAETVPVTSVVVGVGDLTGTTAVTIDVPAVGWSIRANRTLILVSFPISDDNTLQLDAPGVAVMQPVKVNSRGASTIIALVAVFVIYLLALFACGKVEGKLRWDPATITAGKFGKASLSRLQIYGFTLLVAGLMVYTRLRSGVLSDVSNDVLLLLGISAGGTIGAQLTASNKKRLSHENWSWLRNNGWLTAYEDGLDKGDERPLAKWSDVLKTGDEFDVYSLQLVAFSLVVAGALLTSGTMLATFTIPQNLLALLGLSNVVYLGGKAVGTDLTQLNKKITKVREAEETWFTSVTATTIQHATQQAKLTEAIKAKPTEYQGYLTLAREAARMLKSIYGREGTKFDREPIADQAIMPQFP